LEVRLSSRLNITWRNEIKGIDSRRNIVRNPIFTEETNHGPNILTMPVVIRKYVGICTINTCKRVHPGQNISPKSTKANRSSGSITVGQYKKYMKKIKGTRSLTLEEAITLLQEANDVYNKRKISRSQNKKY
jgi:hypothetical protein